VHGIAVDPSDASQALASGMMALVGAHESAKVKQRTRDRHEAWAQAGQFHGGVPGYGHTEGRAGIDEKQQANIIEAANRVVAGESLRTIVLDWTARNITTAKGTPWTVSKLRTLLGQRRLIGEREHHGKVYPAAWPAVIDRELFERANAAMQTRAVPERTKSATRHLGTGFLRCPRCGHAMRGGQTSKNRNGTVINRYVCKDRERGGCGNTAIQAAGVEAEMIRQAVEYLDTADFKRAIDRAVKASSDTKLATVQRDLQRKQVKEREVRAMYDADEIDRAEFLEMRAKVRADIAELEALVENTAGAPPVHLVGAGQTIRDAWEHGTFAEHRDFLSAIVDYVEIRPHGGGPRNRFDPSRVRVHFRF